LNRKTEKEQQSLGPTQEKLSKNCSGSGTEDNRFFLKIRQYRADIHHHRRPFPTTENHTILVPPHTSQPPSLSYEAQQQDRVVTNGKTNSTSVCYQPGKLLSTIFASFHHEKMGAPSCW
jgi:hypothetical protein